MFYPRVRLDSYMEIFFFFDHGGIDYTLHISRIAPGISDGRTTMIVRLAY